jgi:hypothetical protein
VERDSRLGIFLRTDKPLARLFWSTCLSDAIVINVDFL